MADQLVAPEEKKGGFFSSKPKETAQQSASPMVADELTELGRRIRIMEERFSNLRTKLQVMEHNMISHHKILSTEVKASNAEIHELKKENNELKEKFIAMIRDLQAFAQKEDVQVLEKYINLWQPLNFVTKNDVENIVNEVLDKRKEEEH